MLMADVDRTPDQERNLIVYSPDFVVRYCSPEVSSLFGYRAAHMLGRRVQDTITLGLTEQERADLDRRGSWSGTVERRDIGGSSIRVKITIERLSNDSEEHLGYAEHVRREPCAKDGCSDRDWWSLWKLDFSGALSMLNLCLREPAGSAPEAAIRRRAEDLFSLIEVVDVDMAGEQLLPIKGGLSRQPGRSLSVLWPRALAPVLIELITEAVTAGSSVSPDSRFSRAYGDYVVNLVVSAPTLMEVSIGANWLPPLKALQIEASEKRYRTLIQNTPIPIWQVDASMMWPVFEGLRRQGVTDMAAHLRSHPELVKKANLSVMVTEVNQAAIDLFGAQSRDQMLRPVQYLFAKTPEVSAEIMVARASRKRWFARKMWISTFTGQAAQVMFITAFPDPDVALNDTTMLIMIDITDHSKLEARLGALERDYTHAMRLSMLGELATSIAHEVRQPLSVIVTDGDTALRWLARDKPDMAKLRKFISRIVASAHRANQVIERIKKMSNNHEPERAPLDFNEQMMEALSFVRLDSDYRAIRIEVDLAGDLSPIFADKIQLQQVIVNLLINAIQAIDEAKAIVRKIRMRSSALEQGGVLFEIEDSGPGIPEELTLRIFDGFFSTKKGGMGMGLSICKTIIEAHGGSIFVRPAGTGGGYVGFALPEGGDDLAGQF